MRTLEIFAIELSYTEKLSTYSIRHGRIGYSSCYKHEGVHIAVCTYLVSEIKPLEGEEFRYVSFGLRYIY